MSAEIYRESVDPTAPNNPHSFALAMIGSGHRVLEVGCAVGHVTRALVAAGNQVVGVEIDPVAAAEAESIAERVHVADLDRVRLVEIESGTFDVVLLGDVLEHLRDPLRTLTDAVSLLAPAGRVVISVPNVAHIDVRLMLLEGRWDYQGTGLLDATHLRWFTKASLRRLLHDAGLAAVRLDRVRIGRYGSDIDLDPTIRRDDVLGYIEADPEAYTFQYVVEAVRVGDAGGVDALAAGGDHDRPRLDHVNEVRRLAGENHQLGTQVVELSAERDRLAAEVDAWQRSRVVRWTRPVRSLSARVAGRLRR